MIKQITRTSYLILATILLPAIAHGQGIAGRLIVCNSNMDSVAADINNRCDFRDLVVVANALIDLLFQLSLAISVLVLLYVGFKYLTAGTSSAKKDAKNSFTKLAIGFALILGSYLIVNTLFMIAGVNSSFRFLE